MSIWGCHSTATYCYPAAAAGFIYCKSQEWALYSPSPAGFVYLEFSWMLAPFVFSSIQPYTPVAIAVPFYLQFAWGSAPPPLSGAQGTLPSLLLVFVFFSAACLLFSFFSPGWGSVCPGDYAGLSQGFLWKYHVPLICSPGGLCLPSRLGAGVWWHGSPPGFSV
jgi:hypothetical protein